MIVTRLGPGDKGMSLLACPHFMYRSERKYCLRFPTCAAEGAAMSSPEQHRHPRTPRGFANPTCCAADDDCNPPAIDPQRLGQAEEQLAVEAFVPQLAIEALHGPVLPRRARLDEQRRDA